MALLHGDLTERIVRSFYDVYHELGVGFLESVYRDALVIALLEDGLRCSHELPLKVRFRGRIVGDFRADIVVEELIILELKSATDIHPVHRAQVLNYLRASGLQVGLILNFGPKARIERLVRSGGS